MGRSEWALMVCYQEDLDAVEQLVSKHNETSYLERGENLHIGPIIRFSDNLYVCLGNSGGRDLTSKFLYHNTPACMTILWPFAKPPGWYECEAKISRSNALALLGVP